MSRKTKNERTEEVTQRGDEDSPKVLQEVEENIKDIPSKGSSNSLSVKKEFTSTSGRTIVSSPDGAFYSVVGDVKARYGSPITTSKENVRELYDFKEEIANLGYEYIQLVRIAYRNGFETKEQFSENAFSSMARDHGIKKLN